MSVGVTPFGPAAQRYNAFNTSFLTADPAAGSDIANQTVPTGQFWHILGANVTLVTSATVANRQVTLLIDNGANVVARFASSPVQTASLTWTYTWSAGASQLAAVAGTDVVNTLGTWLVLPAGFRIRTSTAGIQGTDDFGAMTLHVVKYTP